MQSLMFLACFLQKLSKKNLWRVGSTLPLLVKEGLTLSAGGGGGSEARMAKLTAANQKALILWCPNLVTFSFYPWDTFWPHFSKIGQSRGLLLLFCHRDVPKILKMKNFSYVWKLLKLTWGVNFGSRRTILDIKTHFFKVKPVFRGLIAEFHDSFPSSEGNFVTSYL